MENTLSPGFRYVIAIGTNMGDREGHIRDAISRIAKALGRVLAVSPIWETIPVGPADQLFLNAALVCEAFTPPAQALEILLSCEREMGRIRKERWGNRIIDLDLLLGCDAHDRGLVVHSEHLTLPHPLMLERDFVLLPAATIARDWVHPLSNRTLGQAWDHLREQLPATSMREYATISHRHQ